MITHLGLPEWHYAFTPYGPSPQAKQWASLYQPLTFSSELSLADSAGDSHLNKLDPTKAFKGKAKVPVPKKKQSPQCSLGSTAKSQGSTGKHTGAKRWEVAYPRKTFQPSLLSLQTNMAQRSTLLFNHKCTSTFALYSESKIKLACCMLNRFMAMFSSSCYGAKAAIMSDKRVSNLESRLYGDHTCKHTAALFVYLSPCQESVNNKQGCLNHWDFSTGCITPLAEVMVDATFLCSIATPSVANM